MQNLHVDTGHPYPLPLRVRLRRIQFRCPAELPLALCKIERFQGPQNAGRQKITKIVGWDRIANLWKG